MTLQIIVNLLNFFSILLIIFGLVFYFAGYKLIRYIDMVVGFLMGALLGYFIGFIFFMSETMGSLLGGILGIAFAFFCFVYYKYLKGVLLGFLAFVWAFYTIASIVTGFNLNLFFVFSVIVCLSVTAIAYKHEKITTMLLTSLLGSSMLLHSFFGLSLNPIASFVSILLGVGGLFIQLKVIEKRFP